MTTGSPRTMVPRAALDLSRLGRLAQKELRETLRDRRTVITLILMPLLVYPILSLIFRTFLLTGVVVPPPDKPLSYRIAVDFQGSPSDFAHWFGALLHDAQGVEDDRAPLIAGYLDRKSPPIVRFGEHEFSERSSNRDMNFVHSVVASSTADAGLVVRFSDDESPPRAESNPPAARPPVQIEIVANVGSPLSVQAAEYLRDYLEAINRFRMRSRGVLDAMSFLVEPVQLSTPQKTRPAISFGTLVPFILVLMTITGAVYPAIDLTAGERERGTMEALVAAPIPRMRILFAKFIAVLTVAMLTATLNLIGMLATIWAFRLEGMIFQSGQFSWISVANVFGLLLLFAAFFSAVLLAVTSFARSFKEAQAYLIPLILLSLAPGIVSLAPGLTLSGPLSLVPLLNFVLLARDILQDQVTATTAIIVVLSTLSYATLAIAIASRIFGTDAILYGSHQSMKDSLRRPAHRQDTASPLAAIFCLTCLFPANFIAISLIGRFANEDLRLPLLIMSIATILFFIGVPLLFAWHQRVRVGSGFAWRRPSATSLAAAAVLGLSVWPISVLVLSLTHLAVTWLGGPESGAAWQQRLIEGGKAYIERWHQLPIGVILLTHAVIPAIAEEWFFRGFLLRSLLSRAKTAAGPIVVSGVVFGAFHLLTESVIALDRLVPTTLMGILLALICWRTGSIIPGIALHALNNATVVSLAYYNEDLQNLKWFPFKNDALPWGWLALVLAIAGGAFAVLWLSTRKSNNRFQSLTGPA